MKRLLIVEDEKVIRQGIHAIVKRSPVPVEEVLECKNGLEALKLLNQSEVDVMITDIRMPVMDGIELVRQAQHLPAPPLIMVISGYDDFSYAVDMFREGVRDYLLKPIDRQRFIEVLKQLNEELEIEKKNRQNHLMASRHVLKGLLLGNYSSEPEIQSIYEQYQDLPFEGRYTVICIPSGSFIKSNLSNPIVFNNLNGHTILIEKEEAVDTLLAKQAPAICAGVSRNYHQLHSLHSAYLEAVSARGLAFMQGRTVLYESGDQKYEKFSIYEQIEQIVHLLGVYNINAIKQILSQIVLFAQNGRISASDFTKTAEKLICSIVEAYPNGLTEEESANYTNIWKFNNVYDYYLSLCNLFELLCDRLKGTEESENKQKIYNAVLYLKENFLKDVDMAVVSNHVSMNYTQFSFLFKQYMGCNFLDYLKHLRLDESKRLLRETDLKIGEISKLSGFRNEKHFMKVFKQAFGVSPSEYRRSTHKWEH